MYSILTKTQFEAIEGAPVCADCGCFIVEGNVAKNYDNNRYYHWEKCITPYLLDEDIASTVASYLKRLKREQERELARA